MTPLSCEYRMTVDETLIEANAVDEETRVLLMRAAAALSRAASILEGEEVY